MLYVVDVNCDIKIIHRYGNTLRFPWAAVEPPCASHCVVSPMPFLPRRTGRPSVGVSHRTWPYLADQESPCISSAGIALVKRTILVIPTIIIVD